jgi:hypothetical protein
LGNPIPHFAPCPCFDWGGTAGNNHAGLRRDGTDFCDNVGFPCRSRDCHPFCLPLLLAGFFLNPPPFPRNTGDFADRKFGFLLATISLGLPPLLGNPEGYPVVKRKAPASYDTNVKTVAQ